jgi:hypothetical protein
MYREAKVLSTNISDV